MATPSAPSHTLVIKDLHVEIGGKEIELVKDYGAISYEQAADNWPAF